jgi:hypothetical protein
MSEKEETGHCWVVRWQLEEKSSVLQDFFQVLPWRRKAEKVKEYLYSLYYNSPTRPVADRADWMNSKVAIGLLVIEEKNRVIIGEHPFLVADLVSDFSAAYDPARDVEVLSYTVPPGTRFDFEKDKVIRNGSPVKINLELKRKLSMGS